MPPAEHIERSIHWHAISTFFPKFLFILFTSSIMAISPTSLTSSSSANMITRKFFLGNLYAQAHMLTHNYNIFHFLSYKHIQHTEGYMLLYFFVLKNLVLLSWKLMPVTPNPSHGSFSLVENILGTMVPPPWKQNPKLTARFCRSRTLCISFMASFKSRAISMALLRSLGYVISPNI